MQGVFVYGSRPKTKKALREAIEAINTGGDPYSVVIEATSLFGNEFDGSLAKALDCRDLACPESPDSEGGHQHLGPFYLVGPDPRTSRKWYAVLEYGVVGPVAEKGWILK